MKADYHNRTTQELVLALELRDQDIETLLADVQTLKSLCACAADALVCEMTRNRWQPEIKDWSELIIKLQTAVK